MENSEKLKCVYNVIYNVENSEKYLTIKNKLIQLSCLNCCSCTELTLFSTVWVYIILKSFISSCLKKCFYCTQCSDSYGNDLSVLWRLNIFPSLPKIFFLYLMMLYFILCLQNDFLKTNIKKKNGTFSFQFCDSWTKFIFLQVFMKLFINLMS